MNDKKWQPWEDFKEDLEMLPIAEPPCKRCIYWQPRRKYYMEPPLIGKYDGVVLCAKAEMEHDFSCFEPKQKAEQS